MTKNSQEYNLGYEQGRREASQDIYERVRLLNPESTESYDKIITEWYSEIHPESAKNIQGNIIGPAQIFATKEFIKNYKGKRARFMGQNNRFFEGEIFGEKDGKIQFGNEHGVLVNINEIVDIYDTR